MEGRRENAVPIFQYVDWGYADDGTLRRLSDCDRSGLQNSGVGDTSMLQDKRLLKGRTIEDSDCGTADYGV